MVQCNIEIEDDHHLDHNSDLTKSNGFHLNPISNSNQDKESDTGSMMSKYKIDLMFTINKKDVKGRHHENNERKEIDRNDARDVQIENKVQEKIDEMFKDIALNDMIKNFYVDYLGSIQLNNDRVQSLEMLQEPLKKLYLLYKKEKQLKIVNKKSILEITTNGLKLNYGNKLEQINSFNTICVWASVKLITRPHGINKEFGLEYCFVPLISDYKSSNVQTNVKFIKLSQNESYLFPKNTHHDNIPIFVIVMKKMCTTKILEVHAFICRTNEDAINIAANLYKTLLITNKNNGKIKQKNGITSCMSVNDSIKGSVSRNSHGFRKGVSSTGEGSRKHSVETHLGVSVHSGGELDQVSTSGFINGFIEYSPRQSGLTTSGNINRVKQNNNETSQNGNNLRHSSDDFKIDQISTGGVLEYSHRQNGIKSGNINKFNTKQPNDVTQNGIGNPTVQSNNKHVKSSISDIEKRIMQEHDRIERYSVGSRCSRKDRIGQSKRRSSSVESVKNYIVDSNKRQQQRNNRRHSGQNVSNLGTKSESVESIRHYVDYVSEAVRNKKNSFMEGQKRLQRHRSNSVESMKDYHIQSNHHRSKYCNGMNRQNSSESVGAGIDVQIIDENRFQKNRKFGRGSCESLRRKSISKSMENILNCNKPDTNFNHCPDLPCPKRKSSNNSTKSINLQSIEFFKKLQTTSDVLYEKRHNGQARNDFTDLYNFKRAYKDGFNDMDLARSRRASMIAQKNTVNSRKSSMYFNGQMNEFDVRDIKGSKDKRSSKRKDSFTNETLARKSKTSQNFDEIEICTADDANKNGDIFTRVAIPRSTSFLKTNSSSRNSLNYTLKDYHTFERRKNSSCKLGFNEIFQELKNQEGLTNLDEILDVIINTDGMSFNELKPIYKEFIVKLALILTKDEFYDKCKIIMNKQKKRKKKVKRNKKVFNKILHSKLNTDVKSLLTCGKKKLMKKTSSCRNSLKRKISPHKKRKASGKNRRTMKEDRNMLLTNEMNNTSSGYFTYSECTYDTDSCTCISADKCYCNCVTRGVSVTNAHLAPNLDFGHKPYLKPLKPTQGRAYKNTAQNYGRLDACVQYPTGYFYEQDRHCYHCFKFKPNKSQARTNYLNNGTTPRADHIQICECDTESCNESDKCYCNLNHNINMLDMLKLQGFAASDTSVDSFKSNEEKHFRPPEQTNWKANLLNKYKDKQYIQASKSLEFVQFHKKSHASNGGATLRNGGTTDSCDSNPDPSSSSFSYKDIEDSSGSSMLDYNLFKDNSPNNSTKDQPFNKGNAARASTNKENKFLVVSARDPKGRIIYVGADKKHLSTQTHDTDAISIKKSAEIASLFMKKQNQASDFNDIGYHGLDFRMSKGTKLESSLGYLP